MRRSVLMALLSIAVLFSLPMVGCTNGASSGTVSNSSLPSADSGSAAGEASESGDSITAHDDPALMSALSGRWELCCMLDYNDYSYYGIDSDMGGFYAKDSRTGIDTEPKLEDYIILNEDDSFEMCIMGNVLKGRWSASRLSDSAADGDLVFDGGQDALLALDTSYERDNLNIYLNGSGLGIFSYTRDGHDPDPNGKAASTSSGDDLRITESGYDDARGKGYKGSDGNYYFMNDDGTYEATDGKGNGVRDLDGDGEADEYTTDSGKTWHRM